MKKVILIGIILLSNLCYSQHPSYEGNGGIATGTNASCSPSYPTTVNADDILIAVIMDADNDSFDVPTGWTKKGELTNQGNLSTAIYWKRATGSESGSVTFTSNLTSGQLVAGIIYRYSGCIETGDPIEQWYMQGVASSNSSTNGFLGNPAGSNRLAINLVVVEDDTINGVTLNSFTEDARLSSNSGSDVHFAAASYALPNSSSPLSVSWSHSFDYRQFTNFYLIPEPVVVLPRRVFLIN